MKVQWSALKPDQRRCRHLPRHKVWVTKDKDKVYLCRMTPAHLQATYNYITRRLLNGDYRLMDDATILSAYRYVETHDNAAADQLNEQLLVAESQYLDPFGGPSDLSMEDGVWGGLDPMFDFSDGPHEESAKKWQRALYAEIQRRKPKPRKQLSGMWLDPPAGYSGGL